MKKYFVLQLKRLMRIFPFAITITVVLFLGLALIAGSFLKMSENDANNQTFKIGISGDTQSQIFQLGKSALETFDSSRFSMEFVEMSEATALSQLEKGEISAYVVIPEEFVENALAGEVGTIKYVTSSGSTGLVSIFKNEITKVVEEIILCSQKGVFGLEDALVDSGHRKLVNKHINTINIEYIELIINRGEMYTVEELGVSGGLSLSEYLLCGISILFVFIIGLPYVGMFVKKDMSLHCVISAKGHNYKKQILAEISSYAIVIFLMVAIMLLTVTIGIKLYPDLLSGETVKPFEMLKFALQLIPVILLATSFCAMIFELTSDIVSAVLLDFFVVVSLCYVSGCLYPIYTFPVIIQKIAPFLPMGAARVYLQGCLADEFSAIGFIMTMVFTASFVTVALFARRRRINARS